MLMLMVNMTPKQYRSAQSDLKFLFKRSALMNEYQGFKSYGLFESLRREIRTPSGMKVCLSDKAKISFDRLSAIIEQVVPSRSLVELDDIYAACKVVLGRWYESEIDGDSNRFLGDVEGEISGLISIHDYYTGLSGLNLQGMSEFKFGDVTVHKPKPELINSTVGRDSVLELAWREMNHGLWVATRIKGSPAYAERRFFELVRSSCGVLAVAFSTCLERGGLGVRLIPNVEGRYKPGTVTWFSVNSSSNALSLKSSFDGLQCLDFPNESAESLSICEWFVELVRISQLHTGNDAEKAVLRGLYWLFDAQADNTLEMKFVKYWSCIECIFSLDKGKVTQQVRRGVLALLCYYRYKPYSAEMWGSLNRRIASLYDLRSLAVHDAQHGHITHQDVIDVSKWAAFILMEVSMMISKGMETRVQLKREVDCIHEFHASRDVATPET
ncbi:hypothetical protein CHR26_17385 [Pseudomonas putida]|nr:hypothetical protein CHR26_17385 [Pseudomonas putida]